MSLDLFPINEQDARRRFLKAVEALPSDAQKGSWSIPSSSGEELSVDHVYLPATENPQRLVVLTSGVHGLEAYAGHAVQSLFLNEFLNKIDRRTTGVFVVHGMNPYGFRHHRRSTESNVNLNRNCSIHQALYQTQNLESMALSERLIPKAPLQSLKSPCFQKMVRKNDRIFIDEISLEFFIKTVGLGQFHSPEGLEYGGKGPEPQIRALMSKLQEIGPDYQDLLLLDLHTGLGHRARLHLLTDGPESVNPELFGELFDSVKDQAVYEFTPPDAEGFYLTLGALNAILPEIAKPGQRVCAITMEYGTLGHDLDAQLDSLNRWMTEHQGSLYGYATPDLEKQVKQLYLEKFFPSDEKWRHEIIKTSREFFSRLIARF